MDRRKLLGLGIQRKGVSLRNVVLGWFEYEERDNLLTLEFKGQDCRDMGQALQRTHQLFDEHEAFVAYYSERGGGYYFATDYDREYGLPSPKRGEVRRYEEDEPDGVGAGSYTRLAGDVARLRQTENEWPARQFRTKWKNFRDQLRTCELHDEPGRGPLKRLLMREQQEHATEWVPAAAMAFAALRACVAEQGSEDEWEGEVLVSSYETATGVLLSPFPPAKKGAPPLPDPLYVFSTDPGGDILDISSTIRS